MFLGEYAIFSSMNTCWGLFVGICLEGIHGRFLGQLKFLMNPMKNDGLHRCFYKL